MEKSQFQSFELILIEFAREKMILFWVSNIESDIELNQFLANSNIELNQIEGIALVKKNMKINQKPNQTSFASKEITIFIKILIIT